MRPRQSLRAHIQELDGLRGMAVGLVMVSHFAPNTGIFKFSAEVTEIGWIGVDLFFVLSGFLITGILLDSAERPDYYRTFYVRRAFRIFPLYYGCLVVIFGLLTLWHAGADMRRLSNEWGSPIWFFVYLANFVTASRGLMPIFAPLGPLWSLQIEEQFYLVFPFIVRRLRSRLPIFLVAAITFALAYRIVMLVARPENPWIQYVGTFARIDSLAFGGLVACARRLCAGFAGRWTRFLPATLLPLFLFYWIAGTASGGALVRTGGYSLNALVFAAIVWWAVANQNLRSTALLRFTSLRLLGKISYGVYLLQLPVQTALKIAMRVPTGTMLRTPMQSVVWTAGTLGVAWVSSTVFEIPIMTWGHSWFAKRLT